MNADNWIAIAAILAAIISPVAILYVKKYLEEKDYSSRRIALINGGWKGTLSQSINGKMEEMALQAQFKVKSKKVTGEISVTLSSDVDNLVVIGHFPHDDFVVLTYRNKEDQTKQFGAIVLKLLPDGKNMRGIFSGHGQVTQNLVTGNAQLRRV